MNENNNSFEQNDIQNNKIMAVLAYIGILVLVPLLAAKDSKFARFHANQGLVLLIVDLISGVVGTILGIIPVVGAILSTALGICILVLAIMGIVNAAKGEAKELPIIGKFTILK